MTREGTMNRIGIDLGVLDAKRIAPPGAPDCPGARVRLTRHDFGTYETNGECFASARQDIPFDGYGDARVRCSQSVAELPKTSSGDRQYYGLCHSCSGLEVKNRQELGERERIRNGGSR